MTLNQLGDYESGSAAALALALAPKRNTGVETLRKLVARRKLVVQAPIGGPGADQHSPQRCRGDRHGALQERTHGVGSPFQTGPLRKLADVEEITFDWVDRFNNDRPHSTLGNIPPEEYEQNYCAESNDPSTGDAAIKTAA